jgi:hypothetical protein
MGGVTVGHLFRKRTVRNLRGQIIDMSDESDGGVIISKGRVVNQEKIDEIAKKELDRKTAATEATQVHVHEQVAEQRTVAPTKMQELEKRIDSQDAKLDAILAALKK